MKKILGIAMAFIMLATLMAIPTIRYFYFLPKSNRLKKHGVFTIGKLLEFDCESSSCHIKYIFRDNLYRYTANDLFSLSTLDEKLVKGNSYYVVYDPDDPVYNNQLIWQIDFDSTLSRKEIENTLDTIKINTDIIRIDEAMWAKLFDPLLH